MSASIVLTEAHSIGRLIKPEIHDRKVSFFLSPDYDVKISEQWAIKQIFDSNMIVIICLLAAFTSNKKSRERAIFLSGAVYFIADALLLFWDNKTSYLIYYAMAASLVFNIYCIVKPPKHYEEDEHKLREMF